MESELIVSVYFRVKVCQDCHRGQSQQLRMFGCGFLGPGQVDSHVSCSALHTHTHKHASTRSHTHTHNDKPGRNTHTHSKLTLRHLTQLHARTHTRQYNAIQSTYTIRGELMGLHENQEIAEESGEDMI